MELDRQYFSYSFLLVRVAPLARKKLQCKLPVIKQIQSACSAVKIETAIQVLEKISGAASLKEDELNVIGELISNMCGALEVHQLTAKGMPEKKLVKHL